MSEKYELLGRYDIKEPQLFKLTVRQYVNQMYKQLCLLRDTMSDHLDFEELFGQYFEQFCDEYARFLSVLEFMHDVGMLSDVLFNAVLMQVETLESEVIGFYKLVYVLDEEYIAKDEESGNDQNRQ